MKFSTCNKECNNVAKVLTAVETVCNNPNMILASHRVSSGLVVRAFGGSMVQAFGGSSVQAPLG